MSKILLFIKFLWYYFWGNFFAIFYYDRSYLKGKYFQGRVFGIVSHGWRWAAYDGASRLFIRNNQKVPWPVSYKVHITNPQNIIFDPDDLHIFHTFGTYFQGLDAKVFIGKGTWIAPNVGLITANHDLDNLNTHTKGKDIILGKKNWVGMNSVILPGVVLGDNTVVGAGSVVTKSFPEGNCVIAGNPAKKIKDL
ncbi:DapH/DapD/GlmU-related protein [Bacillus sp. E(2018)]|uniref:DapH/DapD/GlmU-related protein n=1 Tax=Bacillus sp. E(2018) TaxID=2502239 RepID=UPI002570CD86|nr:DapH/DapD/GlmU-related protein [Bacillus sp. E(2018)]